MKGLWCGLIVIYWLWIWKKCSTLTLICRFLGDRQLFSTAGTWSGSTFKMSVVIILSCISNKITHIYITELWGHSWQYFNFSNISSCWYNKTNFTQSTYERCTRCLHDVWSHADVSKINVWMKTWKQTQVKLYALFTEPSHNFWFLIWKYDN